jgi:hypothetical protein
VAVFSARVAAGEEIGWRGYMLTRLIDAGVPRPVLVSGVIWGLWHVPLILGGVYLAGPPPIVSALLWMVVAISFSFVFARLRLETHLASDRAARGLEQHHSGCVRSGEYGSWCEAVGRRVGNPRHAHLDCRGDCLHPRSVDGPQISRRLTR